MDFWNARVTATCSNFKLREEKLASSKVAAQAVQET
jgi:hypothetical protein